MSVDDRTADGPLRLVDYFVVAGYDHQRGRRRPRGGGGGRDGGSGGSDAFHCQGTILQRFPTQDWKDTPFIEGLEHFCQPNGWVLRSEREQPKFFVAGLTDINGRRHHCAVLSFSEAVAKEDLEAEQQSAADEELEEDNVTGDLGGGGPKSSFASMKLRSLPRHMVPGVSLPTLPHDALMFAPKCLVLVSRHDYPEVLRNCLSVIYTTYSECLVGRGGERIKLETLVGNLLGSVHVPMGTGGGQIPQLRFSLGACDKLSLQPREHETVPATGTGVASLYAQLGIRNVLTLFCAAMVELKVLFYSKSFNRLTEACKALAAVLYPMRYSHVFIPVLPSSLLEVLATPTPFIIGVNSVHEVEIADLLDVIKVDLDGGAITIPENMTVPMVPPDLLFKVQKELSAILHPELSVADDAFARVEFEKKSQCVLDKELRAIMLRLMVHLLAGYRSCLRLVRIHPKPYITFHKAAFLGLRGFCDSLFVRRLLDCMFFNTFVAERGPPWRSCDIFDEAYSMMAEHTALEREDETKVLKHISLLAEAFYRNENPVVTAANPQPYAQKLPLPAEGASSRVHQPILPKLDGGLVDEVIKAGLLQRHAMEMAQHKRSEIKMRLVPSGGDLQQLEIKGLPGATHHHRTIYLPQSARRLDVLRNCIASIFENKISDAKKTFPAVISALKAKAARLALCEELGAHRLGHQVMLEHQQFDMVVRLMNAALQDDSDMDEHGIAMNILPLSTVFGRKLAKGVIQFAYTLIQDHAVWQNMQFWEAAFFSDVQEGIKTLYLNLQDQNSNDTLSLQHEQKASHPFSTSGLRRGGAGVQMSEGIETAGADQKSPNERDVLDLAARETRNWTRLDSKARQERIKAEENTVYSQVLVYVNNMICLMCPLDMALSSGNSGKKGRSHHHRSDDFENASNSVSNSMAESDSVDAESGFEEQEIPDNGQQLIKTVLRFADKVCSESQVTEEHAKNLGSFIPSSVAIHLEGLEAVATQASRLPPIHKSKISLPSLLPGEELVLPKGLRVYLLPDGRREEVRGGVNLLPAEGALFLTTYRIIFKGSPIDPFAAEHTVTRFFPVTSITKEKRFSVDEYLTEIEQFLKEGIQLRSNTFQLIRAAFDDEVTSEEIEGLRKAIVRVQYPDHILQFFAFHGAHSIIQEPLSKIREKNPKYSTIRGLAKTTLKNVTKVTGYHPKKRKTNKYFVPNMMPTQGRLSIAEMTNHENGRIREEGEDGSEGDLPMHIALPHSSASSNSHKSLERLVERIYFRDWVRLGLVSGDLPLKNYHQQQQHHLQYFQGGGNSSESSFRVTTVNSRYSLTPSYPALLLVPSRINDQSLKRYVRCHKHGRFPTITWRHPHTHALLLRGAGFHSRGVVGNIIRRHQQQSDGQNDGGMGGVTGSVSGQNSELASSIEAELYSAAIIQITPRALIKPEAMSRMMSGSQLSINSLVMAGGGGGNVMTDYLPSGGHSGNYSATLTPNTVRKYNPIISKAMDTLTRSAAPPKFSRISLSSLKGNKQHIGGSQSSLASSTVSSYRGNNSRLAVADPLESPGGEVGSGLNSFLQRTALYIFCDKNHSKGLVKLESHPKTELIPVDYPEPRRIRASFKKLMRACVSSTPPVRPDQSFLKQVEASEWLPCLQMIMQVAGAVVDLLDIQRASVSVCLEEGWDVTCQITSLALVCLDPFYRTIEGFRVLVEKEWLSLGHRFNHRSNLSAPNQDAGYTPIFLQFLDAVHQIHAQFPEAFEFNQYYIKFLAFHHVSCRFRTFLLDCEQQRHEFGFFAEKRQATPRGGATDSHSSDEELNLLHGGAGSSSSSSHIGISIFDYIELHASRSTIFYNFAFSRDVAGKVLRPFSHISDLHVWDYFVQEELKHGPSYDLELYQQDLRQTECLTSDSTSLCAASASGGREVATFGHDCLHRTVPNGFSYLLAEVQRLEAELGHFSNRWHAHWEQAEDALPPSPEQEKQVTHDPVIPMTPSVSAKHHGRLMHKRSTMELILKGKIGAAGTAGGAGGSAGAPGINYAHSHRFERYHYSTPTSCEVCSSLLWGPVRTGLRCADCGYNCHEKCKENVPKACSKLYKSGGLAAKDVTSENLAAAAGSVADQDGGVSTGGAGRFSAGGFLGGRGLIEDEDGGDIFRQFSPTASDENSQIICQGYLHKRANFKIKGWRQRWFVLDATKHQLRYYDTREDFHCKGHVDLSDVTKILEGTSTPTGAPRKAEDGCFFELETLRRTFCFCAENRQAAAEWINKIQSCLST